MLHRPLLAAALSVALLAACGGGGGGGGGDPTPGCAGLAGPRAYDARSYALSARYDWDARVLAATEVITLSLCPGAADAIVLDSGVAVSRITAGAQTLEFTEHPATETLEVALGSLAGSREPITFTVEYEAPLSAGLAATTSVEDDPVRSRVVFTDSEPRRGHLWLVQKDDPSDPALFSVTLEVGAGEDAVANGERVLDEPIAGGGRRIGHALDVPVATYLMAFAAGELEHAGRTYTSAVAGGEDVPLSLWYRRGLAVVPEDTLDAVEAAMAVFEDRLGPYPFDRYSTVLLPSPFGGGMENATVTFNSESSSTGWVSDGLNAHELAHHWFGDWVTMATYDDLWVKEGMATLLASESQRAWRDEEGGGRLNGIDFAFAEEDAIVDPSLTGLAKYTSGPYTRSAALITQIRALVGEDAFWSSCRAFLAAHAKGSATGEQFVRAFSPHLDEPTIEKVLAALPQKEVPVWTITFEGAVDGTLLTLAVTDPGNTFLAPLTLTIVTAQGSATVHPITPGTPFVGTVPAGGYAALDEREQRSYTQADAALAPVSAPAGSQGSLAAFVGRSAGHQERALLWQMVDLDLPAELPGLLAALDSDYARRYALRRACNAYAGDGAWTAALVEAAGAPPITRYYGPLYGCGAAVGEAFEAELLALEAAPAAADLDRLEYLLSFRYGPDGVAAIQRLSTGAPTLELRGLATTRLSYEPAFGARAAPPEEDERRVDEGKAARAAGAAR